MKILFLQKRPLFPADTGGKIRTLNVVRHLARWHEMTYLCNVQPGDDPHLEKMRALGLRLETVPWTEAPRHSWQFYRDVGLNVFSPYPFNVAKDYDAKLRARAERLLSEREFDLLVCDFVQMARNAIGLKAPAKVLFQHNVEAEIFERHARHDRGWLRRRFMGHQWGKMRRFEAAAGRQFDAVICVSQRDRQRFAQEYGWSHVHTIDTAVDTDYFHPNGKVEQDGLVLFVGSMDWLPNQDGVEYFVESIWPLVRRSRPGARFQIVGRNPSPDMRRLARAPGVEVVGTVPDVRPYLAKAAVLVVPLRIGGGTRIKIFEALAMGKAVVSTHVGAEGLNVMHDRHVLLEDDPHAFAEAVVGVLDDPARRSEFGCAGRMLVEENFSAKVVARQFADICEQVVRKQAIQHVG